MNLLKNVSNAGDGRLPPIAPLANPYVPFQMENPVRYEARKGLVRGTLYPGLELPFMGIVNKSPLPVTPLSELQAIGFAIQELALYLDTHRDDPEALELYQQYQQRYADCVSQNADSCPPLTHHIPLNRDTYAWLDDPWPWEYAANKGE